MRERDDRHLRLGAKLADLDEAAVARKFAQARVAISWETAVADSAPEMVLLAANLIVRFCPRIHLATEDLLTGQVLGLLDELDSTPLAEFTQGTSVPSGVTASLHLGGGHPHALPNLTTVSAVGWIAYVSSDGEALPMLDPFVTFGYLAAAALGACEVFKRLLPPLPGRGRLFGWSAYSTFNYSSADPEQGPPLPGHVALTAQALLAGVGAVGQSFLHALSTVPGISADLRTVDNQKVDDPNLNRYVLARERDAAAGTDKTQLALRAAEGTSLQITPDQRNLQDVIAEIGEGRLPRPTIVISALDRYEPRRELQNIWPDLLLEGATGDTLLQVFRHSYEDGLACLRCIHTEPTGRPYEEVLAEATGLSAERIAQAFSGERPMLDERDLAQLRPELHEQLRGAVGRDICGVLQELGGFDVAAGAERVEPAVSFTSYLAGLLVAAEFVRAASGIAPGLPGRYQLDPIATLDPGSPWAETKDPGCYCVERAQVISAYRATVDGRSANDHV